MAQSWAEFVWKQHKLVSFPSLDPEDVNLLDVLVKEDSHGFPGFGRGPVLVRIGHIFDLGAPPPPAYHDAAGSDLDSDDDDGEPDGDLVVDLETLRKELGLLRSTGFPRPQLKHLGQTHLGDWSAELDSSSSFLATACGLARASIGGDRAHTCSIRNIKAEKVDVDHLATLFAADPPGWIPNLPTIQQRRKRRKSSIEELELWVVTKIVYSSSIVFGEFASHSAGVTVSLPVSAAGPLSSATVSVDGRTVDYLEVIAPTGPGQLRPGIPVGYQTMRVKYNKGQVSLRLEMGKSRPAHRANDEEEASVDPESQPQYHMGELMDSATSHSLPVFSWESYSPSS